MAEEENDNNLEDEIGAEGLGNKKKLIIIIAAVVLSLVAASAAYLIFFSGSGEDQNEHVEETETVTENTGKTAATYVAMPRPFVFNVQDGKRDRLVQIKVQLMVRGSDNELLAKKHVPLLEGTLVRVFSAATIAQLRSPTGKGELREFAL